MKKHKAPGARSNVVSVKPMPTTHETDPPKPYEGRTSFSGPGLGMSKSAAKDYKKGKG